jgi:hypothetical protein
MEVSKEQFESYEQVRQSGVTNMFNIELVTELADLSREECLYIIEHYSELNDKFPEVRKTNYDRKIGIVNFNKY